VGDSETKRLRRVVRVMNTREKLASPAPSALLGAIVSSMLSVAFLVLGIVRGEYLPAIFAAVLSAVLWARFRREQRNKAR